MLMSDLPEPLIDLSFVHLEILCKFNSLLSRWHLAFVLPEDLTQDIHLLRFLAIAILDITLHFIKVLS